MPKEKPSSVVVHRVELQQKERELLEQLTTAYAVKSWSAPFTALLSSPAAQLGLLGAFLAFLSLYLPDGWLEQTAGKTKEEIYDWLETQNIVVGGTLALLVALSGGGALAIIGAGVGGGAIVEGAEHITGPEGPEWAQAETAAENRAIARQWGLAGIIKFATTWNQGKGALEDLL